MDTATFGARVLEWQERATQLALHQFRPWALTQLAADFAAGRAYWAIGSEASNLLLDLQSLVVGNGVPPAVSLPETLDEWLDRVTTNATRICYSSSEPQSALTSYLICERDPCESAFEDGDRARLSLLAPHVLAAWRHCQQLHVYANCAVAGGPAALSDRLGFLHRADGRFYSMLRRSWPSWGGEQLPEELRAIVAQPSSAVIRQVRWSVQDVQGLRWISGRPLGALAMLKPREQQIAMSIAAGASYHETAERFGFSPNTVRNNVTRILRKVGVRNRYELGLRLWVNHADTLAALQVAR